MSNQVIPIYKSAFRGIRPHVESLLKVMDTTDTNKLASLIALATGCHIVIVFCHMAETLQKPELLENAYKLAKFYNLEIRE